MLSLVSPDGRVHVAVDDRCGARLASIRIDGFDIIVSDGGDALSWGCYPMVPFAGRVRDAAATINGDVHLLPAIAGPHALHGTVLDSAWAVLDHSDARAVLLTDLDAPWPVPGTVRHEISLDDDALTLRLEVTAHDDMPCQVGWHPWFVRPEAYTVPFGTLWLRDEHGITTDTRIDHDPAHPRFGHYDDCFSDPSAPPGLLYRHPTTKADVEVSLTSDCSHWVVFDQPVHAVCIEPQSGPPNQINDAPDVLEFGQSMSRMFRIGWSITRR